MAAQDDSIKARMTCIGQSNLCASAEYVHFQCTHQPIHGAHVCSLQVIQRSLLLSLEAVVIFMGFGLAAWADSGFENFYVAVRSCCRF